MHTKKFSVLRLVLALALLVGLGLTFGSPSSAQTTFDDVPLDSIVKAKGMPALYYYASDGKRYVFPNQKTYDTWFADFSDIYELDLDDIYQIPLGGNVRYRPGVVMVKITTDPKVYVVGHNGVLRWVRSEALARHMYGENWSQLVDDVPDAFFTNYAVGEDIDSEEDFDPDEQIETITTINFNRGLAVSLRARLANTFRCRILEAGQGQGAQQARIHARDCRQISE